MAKFEETLKNSTLTYNTLPEHISKKVDDLDKMFETYQKAIKAKDKETSDNMKKDLMAKDNEIDSLLNKHLNALSKDEKEIKIKPEVIETPIDTLENKVEKEPSEDLTQDDSNDKKITIGFFEC
tara:strand:- start:1790 stop:2161 length:372 start_codon:yes stop_codon:yes gene_type:complete